MKKPDCPYCRDTGWIYGGVSCQDDGKFPGHIRRELFLCDFCDAWIRRAIFACRACAFELDNATFSCPNENCDLHGEPQYDYRPNDLFCERFPTRETQRLAFNLGRERFSGKYFDGENIVEVSVPASLRAGRPSGKPIARIDEEGKLYNNGKRAGTKGV